MISILLDGLGSLMICTHYLIILTKTKEAILYCESFRYGGKTLSTHISIILVQVSIPTKNGSNSHQPSHMPLRDQHSRAHLCPERTNTFLPTQVLQTTHKQPKSS
jgi:hypothetical protein